MVLKKWVVLTDPDGRTLLFELVGRDYKLQKSIPADDATGELIKKWDRLATDYSLAEQHVFLGGQKLVA